MSASDFPALREAIRIAGGIRATAAKIGRAEGGVRYWLRVGRIPKAADVDAVYLAAKKRVPKRALGAR